MKTIFTHFIALFVFLMTSSCETTEQELDTCLCTKNTVEVRGNKLISENQEVIMDSCSRNGENEIIDMGSEKDYRKISWTCM